MLIVSSCCDFIINSVCFLLCFVPVRTVFCFGVFPVMIHFLASCLADLWAMIVQSAASFYFGASRWSRILDAVIYPQIFPLIFPVGLVCVLCCSAVIMNSVDPNAALLLVDTHAMAPPHILVICHFLPLRLSQVCVSGPVTDLDSPEQRQ